MIDFTMNTNENFATFKDNKTGIVVFVDSFDNFDFDVRVGSFENTRFVTTVHALDSAELNAKLNMVYQEVC